MDRQPYRGPETGMTGRQLMAVWAWWIALAIGCGAALRLGWMFMKWLLGS